MKTLNELFVYPKSITATVDMLGTNGIAVIPDYVNSTTLKKLNEEFDQVLSGSITNKAICPMPYSLGKGARIKLKRQNNIAIPETISLFHSSFMKEVSENYLGTKATFNDEIYVVKDVVGSSHHANDLHFDVIPAFKFFLYLSDTTLENGAFTVVPGSFKKTKSIRDKYGNKIGFSNRHLTRELDYNPSELLPIEGKAGTLIIFSTELWHKAGTVQNGSRRVMRGHCVLKKDMPLKKRVMAYF